MPSVELRDLVQAVLSGDLLEAHQWIADARRARLTWELLERPTNLDDREMAVAAGVAELLAARAGSVPPAWARSVPAQGQPVFLDPGIEEMPRTLEYAKRHAPEPLRRRNLVAMPDFLDVR